MPRALVRAGSVFLIALVLFFAWDFSQRIGTNLRLNQSEQDLQVRVANAEATHMVLVARKARVETDQFVEDYVRRNWHWVREGETIVIIQPSPTPPAPTPTPVPTPIPPSDWWQDLSRLLFGP